MARRQPAEELPDDQKPGSGAEVIVSFLENELKAEDARKTSIEARAAGVITTSGALVTLLFGLVAIVTKVASYRTPTLGLIFILAALLLFVTAAALAISATAVRTYQRVQLTALGETIHRDLPTITKQKARNLVANGNFSALDSARKTTGHKANLLGWAVSVQVAAVGALAVAIAIIAIVDLMTPPVR